MAKWHKLRTPLIIVSIISALSCLFVYTYELQKTSLQSETDLPLSYEENEAVASALQKTKTIVTVGIYPLEVYDIDFQRNTYKMTAYVWLSWYTNELVAENNLAPPSTFEIMNSVDSWDFKKTELISDTMSNGKSYYLMKIDGMFFQNFDVSRYPMDRQKLTITF